jgi:ankyrin repeat protein
MRAVQRRDGELVQLLLASGADPDLVDRLAGMSARDYAARDTRSPAIAEALKTAPKVQKRAVAGPSF